MLFILIDSVQTPCGGFVAVQPSKEITLRSPNFPNPFPKDKMCAWRVCPPVGKRLEIRFDKFDLRSSDRLEITNGMLLYPHLHHSLIRIPVLPLSSTPTPSSSPLTCPSPSPTPTSSPSHPHPHLQSHSHLLLIFAEPNKAFSVFFN